MNIKLDEIIKLSKSIDKLLSEMNDKMILLNIYDGLINLVESKYNISKKIKKIKKISCNIEVNCIDHTFVCKFCGLIYGYELVSKPIMFYNVRDKLKKTSIYKIKYYILKVINNLYSNRHKNNLQNETISYIDRNKICLIFEIIPKKLFELNIKNKRLKSIKFILRKICIMLNYLLRKK